MKCLSAFGVIIDTTKPSILGQKISKNPINIYMKLSELRR